MAVLNNYYGDGEETFENYFDCEIVFPFAGIKWPNVACNHEKPIICEDVEGHLGFARQKFQSLRIP